MQAAARTGERVYRHRPTPIPMVSGTGPVHAPRGQFGVPMIIAGVGYTGSRTHGPDEHICVTDFIAGTHYIAALIDELAE